MGKFNPGDLVQIKRTGKSKYKDAIGIIERYCNGRSPNVCRVKLWKNCTIQIYDWNLETFTVKENHYEEM